MKTDFDILKRLYPVINVSSVTDIISGDVYRRKKLPNSELEDIVINILDNRNAQTVQPGVANINCFCRNLDNGMPNETRLKAITDAVISVLEAYNKTVGIYFQFHVVWQNTFQDNIQEVMSYTNIRINTFIENL